MFSPVLDLFGGDTNEKEDTNSEDNQPLSWKISKKGSFSFTKAPPKPVKPPGTRLNSWKLMKEALEENKNNTKKRRMLKKKRVIVVEPLVEKGVTVEKSDKET